MPGMLRPFRAPPFGPRATGFPPARSPSLPMKRVVAPEMLDSLNPEDPEALRNRRDLRLINGLQGNYRWIYRQLRQLLYPAERGCEFGAGTGDLGRFLQRKRGWPENAQLEGIDLWERPPDWPDQWAWQQKNLLDLPRLPYQFVIGNMIFHQFEDEVLQRWGSLMDRDCRFILACEPVRRNRHLKQLEFLRPFRLSPVSWHDARVSIRAGFRHQELPEMLGLDPIRWTIYCRETFLGSYRMLALRKDYLPVPVEAPEGVPA